MLINIEINVAHRRRSLRECVVWDGISAHLHSPMCSERPHFGKTGWERLIAAEAVAMYPNLLKF